MSDLLLAVVLNQAKSAHNFLDTAYEAPVRITPAQYEAAKFILENTPIDSNIVNIGTLTYPKQKFIQFLSHRLGVWLDWAEEKDIDMAFESINRRIRLLNLTSELKTTHAIIDYSDLAFLAGHPNYDSKLVYIQQKEAELVDRNATKIYDKDNIKIYDLNGD